MTTTIYEIMVSVIGTPANEIERLVIFQSAGAICVILFFATVYIFKVIGQLMRKD